MSATHSELVDRMAKLRDFIANGNTVLRRHVGGPNDRTAKIAQAIRAAEIEHDLLRKQAIAARPADWLPG